MMIIKMKKFLVMGCWAFVAASVMPTTVYANYAQRADVKQFINEMVYKHGFDRTYLESQFAAAKRLDNVLESIAKPAEKVLTWKQYRPIFVTSQRSEKGKKFIAEYKDVLQRAEK